MTDKLTAAAVGLVVGWLAAPGISKTQGVRLLDVVLLGPLLVFWSVQERLDRPSQLALAFIGGATASYNLRNYLKYLKGG